MIARRGDQLFFFREPAVGTTNTAIGTNDASVQNHGVYSRLERSRRDKKGLACRGLAAMDSLFNDICVLVTAAFVLTFVPGLRLPERPSVLVEEVLTDSTYRDRAGHFQKVIAETNGLSAAADLLEQAFGLNQKTSNGRATVQRQVKQ